jgi:hypothetical protein
MESSAKTGINAQRIFIKAAETLYGENIKYQRSSNEADGEATQATPVNKANDRKRIDNKPKKKQGGCC